MRPSKPTPKDVFVEHAMPCVRHVRWSQGKLAQLAGRAVRRALRDAINVTTALGAFRASWGDSRQRFLTGALSARHR